MKVEATAWKGYAEKPKSLRRPVKGGKVHHEHGSYKSCEKCRPESPWKGYP